MLKQKVGNVVLPTFLCYRQASLPNCKTIG